MCGICGIVNATGDPRRHAAVVDSMTGDLERRGPDDEGTWADPSGQAALGFRRLAIIDPGPGGSQPMWSHDGSAVLVFNGEIYNHRDIGKVLEQKGVRFRSTSDTEVLLAGLQRWGPDVLPRLRGMFAFAYYRPERRTLFLARDHAGMKPLFFAHEPSGPGVAFSSRYDSLFRTGWLDPDRYDPAVLADYVQRRQVRGSGGLHVGADQVGPGQYLTAGPDGIGERTTWWSLTEPDASPLRGDEAVEAVGEALDRSVRRHLVSDVPVGVFFSGGVDSPLVAGTATAIAGRRYPAFTIGYPGWDQDETAAAATMAGPLNVDHHVRSVERPPDGMLATLLAAQDEPLNDWSILPTLLVAEEARRHVTVALSGDGGDELFFGYDRSWSLTGTWWLWPAPRPVRRVAMRARRMLRLPRRGAVEHRSPTDYYDAMQSVAGNDVLGRIAPGLATHWDDRAPAGHSGPTDLRSLAAFSRRREFEVQLPRILRKVDQASMHHSLEVRVPLLDPDVIEAALRIDSAWTLRQRSTKPVLRSLLRQHLGTDPPEPKLGFGAPIAAWMADDLREPMHDAFRNDISSAGVFDGDEIRRLWAAQLAGTADHRTLLWGLASLSWWESRVRTTMSGQMP